MIDIKKVKENFMYHKIFVVRLTQSVVQFLSWWAFCFYFLFDKLVSCLHGPGR